MPDRVQALPIRCKGGLKLSTDLLTQGTNDTGSCTILQNMEPSLDGGYEKILGFAKWDTNTVTGDSTSPLLGVAYALSGNVFAGRLNVATTGVDIYKSTGSGWSKINSTALNSATTKIRTTEYSIVAPVIIFTNGKDFAQKYDGSTYTIINGTGSKTDPKFATEFLNRLVVSGYTSNVSAIAISAPNDDEVWSGGGAIEINVGDVVTGLRAFRDTLYIFCENSIKKLTGSSSSDFAVNAVTDSIGCIAGDTIQEVGGDLLFLAPDGIRSLAATDRIGDVELGLLSSDIRESITADIGSFNEDDWSSCTVRKKSQYRLFLQDSSAVDENAKGWLGKLDGREQGIIYEWATLKGINAYSCHSAYDNDTEVVVFGHPSTGFVFQLETGNAFLATDIDWIYASPPLTFGDAFLRTTLYKIILFTSVDGNVAFDLDVNYNRNIGTLKQPNTVSFAQTGTVSVFGMAVYGTDSYSVNESPIFVKTLRGSGNTATFTFSGTDSNPPIRIDSFEIQYKQNSQRIKG